MCTYFIVFVQTKTAQALTTPLPPISPSLRHYAVIVVFKSRFAAQPHLTVIYVNTNVNVMILVLNETDPID